MLIKVKSHSEHFDYKEISRKVVLTQLKVAHSDIKDLEIYKCNINRGDMIIFDHKCVHCTEEVPTKDKPRVAFVRLFAGKSKGEFIPTTSTLMTKKHGDFLKK